MVKVTNNKHVHNGSLIILIIEKSASLFNFSRMFINKRLYRHLVVIQYQRSIILPGKWVIL